MHGPGTLLYAATAENKRRYDGLWKCNKRHGKGRDMSEDGSNATQGRYEHDDNRVEGNMFFNIGSGSVNKYTNGELVKQETK